MYKLAIFAAVIAVTTAVGPARLLVGQAVSTTHRVDVHGPVTAVLRGGYGRGLGGLVNVGGGWGASLAAVPAGTVIGRGYDGSIVVGNAGPRLGLVSAPGVVYANGGYGGLGLLGAGKVLG